MYSSRRLQAASLATAAAVAVAGAAEAHAHLVTSSPAANATQAAPAQIWLRFSEAPLAKFSGVQLMTGGHVVPIKMIASNDKNTLVAAPETQLKVGVYKIDWHAVTADTHRTRGVFAFTVR